MSVPDLCKYCERDLDGRPCGWFECEMLARADKAEAERNALKAEVAALKTDYRESLAAVADYAIKWQRALDERDAAQAALGLTKAAKNAAYAERNQCVALLARMAEALGFKVGIGTHPAEDTAWEPDWRTILFVDLPTGQVSWHFHDSELGLLSDLVGYGKTWDGHDTTEKYRRVRAALATALADAMLGGEKP